MTIMMNKKGWDDNRPPIGREERSNRVRVGKTYIHQVNDNVNIRVAQLKRLLEGVPDDSPVYNTYPKCEDASLTDGNRIEIEIVELIGIRLRGGKKELEIEYIPVKAALEVTSGFGSEWELVGKPFKAVRIGSEEPEYEL